MGTLVTSAESQLVDNFFLEAVRARQGQGITQNQMIMAMVTLYKAIDEGVIKLPSPPTEENLKEFREKINGLLAKAAEVEKENPRQMEAEVQTMIEQKRGEILEFYARNNNGQAPKDLKNAFFQFIVGHSVKTKGVDAGLNSIFEGLGLAAAMAQPVDRATMPTERGAEAGLPIPG